MSNDLKPIIQKLIKVESSLEQVTDDLKNHLLIEESDYVLCRRTEITQFIEELGELEQ